MSLEEDAQATGDTPSMPVPLRAYLACALTQLPEDRREAVYGLCRELQRVCAGHGVALYLPFDHTDPMAHPHVPPPLVYATDRKQVVTSDLVFILCVAASYGVGQENEIATSHGIPVVYLIGSGSTVSRMLVGSDSRKRVIRYSAQEDLLQQVSEMLKGTVPALRKMKESLSEPVPLGIGLRIRDLRLRTKVSLETLADLIGVGPEMLTRVEEHAEEEVGLTVQQLRRAAASLGVDMAYLLLGATVSMDEVMRRSLDNLNTVAREDDMLYSDHELLWGEWVRRATTQIGFVTAARRGGVVSKEQWRVWYRKMLDQRGGLQLG
jgi:transcriptional regulator with XRE-family HTH domain